MIIPFILLKLAFYVYLVGHRCATCHANLTFHDLSTIKIITNYEASKEFLRIKLKNL